LFARGLSGRAKERAAGSSTALGGRHAHAARAWSRAGSAARPFASGGAAASTAPLPKDQRPAARRQCRTDHGGARRRSLGADPRQGRHHRLDRASLPGRPQGDPTAPAHPARSDGRGVSGSGPGSRSAAPGDRGRQPRAGGQGAWTGRLARTPRGGVLQRLGALRRQGQRPLSVSPPRRHPLGGGRRKTGHAARRAAAGSQTPCDRLPGDRKRPARLPRRCQGLAPGVLALCRRLLEPGCLSTERGHRLPGGRRKVPRAHAAEAVHSPGRGGARAPRRQAAYPHRAHEVVSGRSRHRGLSQRCQAAGPGPSPRTSPEDVPQDRRCPGARRLQLRSAAGPSRSH